jgi:hypothetical protein
VLALVKRPSALLKAAFFGDTAAALGGDDTAATAIALVAIPPEGDTYYSQICLILSSEDAWLQLSLPLSYLL